MGAPYARTAAQRSGDFAEAKEFEAEVASYLPGHRVTRFDSTEALDIWLPGAFIDVKEKKQRITDRWMKHVDWPERDTFILDELSIRKACKHWPEAFFLCRDRPEDRLFLLPIVDLVVVERVRVQRVGKGKALLNLQNFKRVPRLEDLHELIQGDLAAMRWKKSECLGAIPAPQV